MKVFASSLFLPDELAEVVVLVHTEYFEVHFEL